GQGADERVAIVSLDATTEPPIQHRTVERDDAMERRQVRENRRQVAVADEGLRRAAKIFPVEERQHVHAAEAAADRDQRLHRRVSPRTEEGLRADGPGARDISGMSSEHRLVEYGLETELLELADPLVELFALE